MQRAIKAFKKVNLAHVLHSVFNMSISVSISIGVMQGVKVKFYSKSTDMDGHQYIKNLSNELNLREYISALMKYLR